MRRTRECRVDACTNRHTPDTLMCRQHWLELPRPLRDALWAAFNGEPFGDSYNKAAAACFAFVGAHAAAAEYLAELSPVDEPSPPDGRITEELELAEWRALAPVAAEPDLFAGPRDGIEGGQS